MMSTLLILLFVLSRLYALNTKCGWAYLDGKYIALNTCQKYFDKNEFNSNVVSYTIECNNNGTGLQYKYFTESSTCNDNGTNLIQSLKVLSMKDSFNCHMNKTICNNMIYRTYNECPYDNNTSYTDLNLITNTCLINEKSDISQYITCNKDDNSYSINTHNDSICETKNILDTKIIYMNNTDNCSQITHCYSQQIDTPVNTVTNCKFINYNGTGYRIDICNENVINSKLYSYKFHCNDIGNVVSISYYRDTNECNSEQVLFSLPITDENVVDFQCGLSNSINKNIDNTCNVSNYMQLKIYENDNGCLPDTEEYSEYTIHDIITGHCLKDTNDKYCIYECNNNNNNSENGYFTITYFNNDLCEGEPDRIISYNENDCYNNKLTHMIFCNGINNINIPIIDYNYFIDDYYYYYGHGRPLNMCSNKIINGIQYSYKYKCNSFNNGIDKYMYKDTGCVDNKLENVISDTHIKQFYCNGINDIPSNDLFVLKHYTNYTCNNKSNDFYFIEYMLINQCWPNKYGTYSKVTCNEYSYTTTIYTDSDCNQIFQPYEYSINGSCESWDNIYREVMYCPTWNNATWSLPTYEPVTVLNSSNNSTDLNCRWVNFNGNARRIDICNIAPYNNTKWSYTYQCKLNIDGFVIGVIQNWWMNSNICKGEPNITTDMSSHITSYNCNSDFICSDYIQLITYDKYDEVICKQDNKYFISSELIINQCFMDDYNQSKLIQCNPNGNGYIVYEYFDAYCYDKYLWKITEIPNKICQIATQRFEIMETCNLYDSLQVNNSNHKIKYNVNFTQCNYFYNGLFGIAIDVCNVYKQGNNYKSVMYKCNDEKNKIIQYEYFGSHCDINNQIGGDETSYSIFYCENTINNLSNILKMKWYENDSCIKDEGFWSESNVIMNVCWANYDTNTSAMVLFNGYKYNIYRYNNIYCEDEPLFTSIYQYESSQCVDGNILVTSPISNVCNYWISVDGIGFPIGLCYKIQSNNHIYKGYKFQCDKYNYNINKIKYNDNECNNENNIIIETID
eukprot:535923_1